jgi:hypothetical protein
MRFGTFVRIVVVWHRGGQSGLDPDGERLTGQTNNVGIFAPFCERLLFPARSPGIFAQKISKGRTGSS